MWIRFYSVRIFLVLNSSREGFAKWEKKKENFYQANLNYKTEKRHARFQSLKCNLSI